MSVHPASNSTARLASFAAGLTLSDVPLDFRKLLPYLVLDTSAALLAGITQPVYHSTAQMVKAMYGKGTSEMSCLCPDGEASSLSGAMLLMGLAAGDFEFEHVAKTTHPASSVFPALLCVASTYGKSGENVLAAMTVGYELATRIGFASTSAVETSRGFHNPGLNGHLASAAAVCRLMGWSAETVESAMGIGASSASGLMSFHTGGAMTKRIHPARAGQLGAEAAFLANAGFAGPRDVLEDVHGFLRAFSPKPQLHFLSDGLGTHWYGSRMILKLSPAHACVQAFVWAINQYRDESGNAWNVEDVESITVYAGPLVLSPAHWIVHPDSLVAAQYSVPFSIAAAVALDLRNALLMNDNLVRSTAVHAVSSRVTFVKVTEDTAELGGFLKITVKGQEVNIAVENYPGLPGSEGYITAVEEKFERVIKSLGIENEGHVLQSKILSIARLENVSDLLTSFVNASKACRHEIDPSASHGKDIEMQQT